MLKNFSLFAFLLCSACAAPQHYCPLGGMTEFHTAGKDAEKMAMTMAAKATLKDGYDRFSIVRKNGDDASFTMLVHMFQKDDDTRIYETILPGDVLAGDRQPASDV